MNKYKVGDKFIVEIEEIYNGDLVKHEEHMHLHRIKGFNSLVLDEYGLDKLQKYDKYAENLERNHEVLKIFEEKYSKGLNDAWELARKLELNECDGGFSNDTIAKAFGRTVYDTFRLFTPKQALAKIGAYEESKAIKVGDVVYIDQVANDELEDDSEAYGVVTGIYDDSDHYEVLMRNGDGVSFGKRQMEKTGKHIDIEHLLEQIKGK